MSRHLRHQSVISRQSDQPLDEDHWLSQFQKNLQKGAVQPRTQESLFDQINSIMNTNSRSKYTSVEAAVEDMKERSGLTAYLDKINKTSSEEPSVKTVVAYDANDFFKLLKYAAKAKNWYELGRLVGKSDKEKGKVVNAIESMVFFHYYNDPELRSLKVPVDGWHVYTMGYGEGAGLSDIQKERDYDFTSKFIEVRSNKKSASDSNSAIDKKVDMTPVVMKKHPPILKTLENYIRDTRGNLPVPAIIDKLRSIHQQDCSDAKDWDDDKLIRLVSRLNLGAKKNNPDNYTNYNNLGSRDGDTASDIDPSNTDAFFALAPSKV